MERQHCHMSFDVFYVQTSRHYVQFFCVYIEAFSLYVWFIHKYITAVPANFVIFTLLPIILCAFFYIYSASVSMCSQNFVICGAFSCYLTFNAALITDRKIMSCGCSLWSRRHVIMCSFFAFISRHSPFMCGVF